MKMKLLNNKERMKQMIFFAVSIITTAGLVFIVLNSLKQDSSVVDISEGPAVNNLQFVQTNKLLQYDELLHAKLNNLQQMDEEYAAILADPLKIKNPDSLNKNIQQQENYFSQCIDSVNQLSSAFTDKTAYELFTKMIYSFRSILDYRKSADNLRNAVAISQDSFTPDKNAMLELRNELSKKETRISMLEHSLSVMAAGNGNTDHQDDVATIKLNKTISDLENKITLLTTSNNNLKQDNDRMLKLQNENVKNNSSTEMQLKEKTSALQQKIEMLNAELQLARVDCNLSRVDAMQIISTAKQRKQLLTEASSILTDLAVSGNSDIKRKARNKIALLNQVAANTRE